MEPFRLTVDAKELNQLALRIARFRGSLDKDFSRALNFAAWDATKHLRQVTPRYVDRPTPWTVNATFVRKSTPQDLSLSVGFKDTAVKGTPAARFLQPMVGGGARRQKPSERRLIRASARFSGLYLVPTGKAPMQLDQYGNVPRGKMTQVLSRIKALDSAGSTGNVSVSKRSKAKRRKVDFFVGYRGGRPITINQRVGRGYVNVFNLVRPAPKYEARFPVREILFDEVTRKFPDIFSRLVFKQR
jgi:hypothetical protein